MGVCPDIIPYAEIRTVQQQSTHIARVICPPGEVWVDVSEPRGGGGNLELVGILALVDHFFFGGGTTTSKIFRENKKKPFYFIKKCFFYRIFSVFTIIQFIKYLI